MLAVGHNFKVKRCVHTKMGDTLLFLTAISYKTKKENNMYKNYSFFLRERLENYNVNDMILIERIDAIDYNDHYKYGKKYLNVNVYGEVSLVKENKSAIKRELDEEIKDLPFDIFSNN